LEGEALGLQAAMEFVVSKGIQQVVIEMDAQFIVNAANRRRYTQNYWGGIARQCGDFLSQNPRSSIRWTRKSGNGAAHILANWASFEPDHKEWVNETPHCIWACIQKDKVLCNLS
jgi:ribonuclease HI